MKQGLLIHDSINRKSPWLSGRANHWWDVTAGSREHRRTPVVCIEKVDLKLLEIKNESTCIILFAIIP